MEFKVNDSDLDAAAFIRFATQIWNGDYDPIKTQAALSKNAEHYRIRFQQPCRLSSDPDRRIFFRHNHRIACSPCIPKPRHRQPLVTTRQGKYPYIIIFWRTAAG